MAVALVAMLGLLAAGVALAQEATPTAPAASDTAAVPVEQGRPPRDRGFGFFGGSTAVFDAQAEALGLTPTGLFEQLHSGKTLSEIAEAQGVDLATVEEAARAAQVQAMKDAIAQAVQDGTMTQAQADWLLEGLEKGYLDGPGLKFFGGRGMGHGPRGGMPGLLAPPESAAPDTSG